MQVLINTETIIEKKLWKEAWTGCILATLNSNVNFFLSSYINYPTVEKQIFMSLNVPDNCYTITVLKDTS